MQTSVKIIDILESKNFAISLISIILFALSANKVNVEGYTPSGIYDLLSSSTGSTLIGAIVTLLFGIVSKVYISIQQNGWNFAFVKSDNFKAAVLSILSIFIGAYFNSFLASVIISLLVQALNVFYHFLQPVSPVTPLVVIVPLVDEKKSL